MDEYTDRQWNKEKEGYITHHGTFSRVTILYQVVFYTESESTYIAKIVLDVDYWGEFSCDLSLDPKY